MTKYMQPVADCNVYDSYSLLVVCRFQSNATVKRFPDTNATKSTQQQRLSLALPPDLFIELNCCCFSFTASFDTVSP